MWLLYFFVVFEGGDLAAYEHESSFDSIAACESHGEDKLVYEVIDSAEDDNYPNEIHFFCDEVVTI